MLGSNDASKSFVIGYGDDFPKRPHHRAASSSPGAPYESGDSYTYVCDDSNDVPHTLRGALVGGAEKSTDYVDDCNDYIQNEVAIDYNSGFTGALAGLVELLCADDCSSMEHDYASVLGMSYEFYEAQRSGTLNASTNRVAWRGDSFLDDGSDNDVDLVGGWFDAGDHVKFGMPLAKTVATLSLGLIEFEAGYTTAGELENALDGLKWATDWILKAHVSDDEIYVQVGDGDDDHDYWGPPELAMDYFVYGDSSDDNMLSRPSYAVTPDNHGTDVVADYAAALASASIVFSSATAVEIYGVAYSEELLEHAKQLYDVAKSGDDTSKRQVQHACTGVLVRVMAAAREHTRSHSTSLSTF